MVLVQHCVVLVHEFGGLALNLDFFLLYLLGADIQLMIDMEPQKLLAGVFLVLEPHFVLRVEYFILIFAKLALHPPNFGVNGHSWFSSA